LGLWRHPVLVATAVALVGASGAACTTVLGLLEPTLDPCAGGCPDTSVPGADASGEGSSGGGDATSPGDAVADTSLFDATVDAPLDAPDAIPDVALDRGPSNGTRCGPAASAIFCPLPQVCCLTLDEAGSSASYACGSSASSCGGGGGYSIACTTNNDCNGSDICCFYSSSIKCEPQNTGSCTALVCDPSGPADQCPTGQKCTVAYIIGNNYALPYYGCH
jgi:hypothetical protein